MALKQAILTMDAASTKGQSILSSAGTSYSQPFLIELESKVQEKLTVQRITYNAVSDEITHCDHWHTEESTSILVGKDALFYPKGLIAINSALLLESLTPTFVSLHDQDSDCAYKKFELKAGAAAISIDSTRAVETLDPFSMYVCPFVFACSNYGHWHYNVLSSIALTRKHLPDSKLLLPKLSAYQRESLSLLSLEPDRIVEVDGSVPFHVPNFAFPSPSWTWSGIPNPKLSYLPMQSMAVQAHKNNISHPRSSNHRRIYVTRMGDKIRPITNEDQVCALFEEFGFLVIRPIDYKYEESISIFANAEFVAGPVGSALSRIGFCRPGFRYLQLSFEGSHHYFMHCNAWWTGASKSYTYLEDSRNVTHAPSSKSANLIEGWSINIRKLRAFLDSIV